MVPGLTHDAAQYAKTILTIVPKTARLSDLISEPSQEARIIALADRIAKTGRRILIILDDLDRMEAHELEKMFKIPRGSEKLSNLTFVCAFDVSGLVEIIKTTRPGQNTRTFIERFFQLQIPLPTLEPAQLRNLFREKLIAISGQYGVRPDSRRALENISGLVRMVSPEGAKDRYFPSTGSVQRIPNENVRL